MSAIPDSTLPGHRALHERVEAALRVCQESRDIEFKSESTWSDLRYSITRTCLGMANLRDGGVIIVGVEEANGSWVPGGIGDNCLASYDEDAINDFVNKYASPPLRVELVTVRHEALRFLAIRVPEFDTTPIVCKADAGDQSGLSRGSIFVRPIGKPETCRVREAGQLEDLLELASDKRARRFLERAFRLGLSPKEAETSKFDRELEGL